MSDPVPTPVTNVPDPKPSDQGSFAPLTVPEIQQKLEILEGLIKDVPLLRKQMDHLRNTYFREAHFPTE